MHRSERVGSIGQAPFTQAKTPVLRLNVKQGELPVITGIWCGLRF